MITFLKQFLEFGIFTFGSSCDLKKEIRSFRKLRVVILELTWDFPFAILIKIVRIWLIVASFMIDSSFPSMNFSAISFSKFFKHYSALILSCFYLSPNINNKSSSISGRYCSKSTLTISLRTFIHRMRNCRIAGFMLLNLDLRIPMNYFILKSSWF